MTTVTYYTKAGHTITFDCEKISVKHGQDGAITSIDVQGQDRRIVIPLGAIEAIVF